ncbi:MAG: FG-GAP-like repeat-containing protein [Pirellulales bacterium]
MRRSATPRGSAGRRNRIGRLAAGELLERRDLMAVDVTRTSLNLRFSADPTAARPTYGEYQTFAVTNSGPETYADVWFRATDFVPGQKVQLGSGEDGLYELGSLGPGETKTAFIYMAATDFTSPVGYEYQYFTAEAWDGNPTVGSPTLLASEAEQFEWVGEAIVDASSVKQDSITVGYFFGATPTAVPVVGGTMVMTVTGRVYNKPDRVLFTPATTIDWPADAFELASAVVTYSNPPQLPPDSIFEKPIPPASTPKDFSVVYTFRIEGTTAAPTPVTATAWTANGVQTPLNRKFEYARLLDGIADIPAAQEATALEITKTGTTTAVAGSATVYSHTITVSATGAFDSQGVAVADIWPAGFTKLPIIPPAGTTITGETAAGFTWNIGTLAAGTTKSLTVNFTVPATTAPGPFTDTATVSSTTPNPNPKTASVSTTVVDVPLTIAKAPSVTVVAGAAATQTYLITVTNAGGFTAEGVAVADAWPAALNRLPITPPAGTTITGETATGFTWTIGTLAAGATRVLTVSYTVPKATAPAAYANTATLSSSTANPNPKTSTATTTVVTANLSITKTPNATVPAGTSAVQTYTITVANTSGFTAEGVAVADAWPAAFARLPITPPADTTITGETATAFTWTIGTLAAGATLVLTVSYTVPKATAVGSYANTATLSSTTADPGSLTATATTTVVAVDLTITKVGDAATVKAGTGGHWYRITVTNTSTAFAAENVTVVDTWPAEFPKAPIVPPAGTTISGETATGFTWNIGLLAPLATVQLQVDFSVPSATPLKSYTNTAVVSSDTQDPGEKTAVATTLVDPPTTPGLLVSSDDGCKKAFVQVMTATGDTVGPVLQPYGNVCGGVRAAAGDLDGDGIDELIVAPGRGIAGPVKVYDFGSTTPLFSFYPYGAAYRGGVELACADVNNDGRKDIVTGMSLGVGTVNVYTVNGVASLFRTFRGAPAGYAGGVRIAAADFGTYQNGVLVNTALDGKAEVVVGPNAGAMAQVGIYDLSPATPKLARTIIPFGPGYTGGVTLSTGNYDGDAFNVPDIFVGAGIGRQSVVSVFNAQTGGQIGPTLAFFSSFARPNAAVNVQPVDINGDGIVDNLYGVQGLSGGGGTQGVRRVELGGTPTISTLQNYLPPLRIKAVNVQGLGGLRLARKPR